jgi:hypothetical protein
MQNIAQRQSKLRQISAQCAHFFTNSLPRVSDIKTQWGGHVCAFAHVTSQTTYRFPQKFETAYSATQYHYIRIVCCTVLIYWYYSVVLYTEACKEMHMFSYSWVLFTILLSLHGTGCSWTLYIIHLVKICPASFTEHEGSQPLDRILSQPSPNTTTSKNPF